jgi:transposase
VVDDLSQRLVPDELWALAAPLIPGFDTRPQGGGTAPVDDRPVFTAIVFVLTSGCAWRYLPPSFGVTRSRWLRSPLSWLNVPGVKTSSSTHPGKRGLTVHVTTVPV